MIEVTWATPAPAERQERIAAQCAIAKQAAQRLYQQDMQHGGPVAPPARPEPTNASAAQRARQQAQQLQPAILMSAANPRGFKLEDLLTKIWHELQAKNARLQGGEFSADAEGSKRLRVSTEVRENNERIAALLLQATYIQGETKTLLDTLGPDQGPTGKPRL